MVPGMVVDEEEIRRMTALRCLPLLNREHDLRDFAVLVRDIERARLEVLTVWKNEFTTNFFRELKAAVRIDKPEKDIKDAQRHDMLLVQSLSNFDAFTVQYDEWMAWLRSPEARGSPRLVLTKFFDFVSSKKFIITAPSEAVFSEFRRLMESRMSQNYLKWIESSHLLLENGYSMDAMISFMQRHNEYKEFSHTLVEEMMDEGFGGLLEEKKKEPAYPRMAIPLIGVPPLYVQQYALLSSASQPSIDCAAALLNSLAPRNALDGLRVFENDGGVMFEWSERSVYCDIDPHGIIEVSRAGRPTPDRTVKITSEEFIDSENACKALHLLLS